MGLFSLNLNVILTFAYCNSDLVPVSSTVIPLSVYEVSYGTKDGKVSEEQYKRIYMKNMKKKAHEQHKPGLMDKLVTGEKRIGCQLLLNEDNIISINLYSS